ncbi:hypothetical protein SAMN04488523_103144 [Sulfitobacter brevis]|uniref:Uncharacterized protein n=1 Tax=Sulfitobacter brevis TaxID=74348 RepID=A0A1I1VU27_9RHOB|nr:hypothetical protein [Sulfitobacter brevis]SFD86546.1 hypothetical protein SAMN04488523_103144 [Sulfitobacter brevis]
MSIMSGQTGKFASTPEVEIVSSKSHLIFVAVGMLIVIGGLWVLYNFDAPYHPEIPVSDSQQFQISDS